MRDECDTYTERDIEKIEVKNDEFSLRYWFIREELD